MLCGNCSEALRLELTRCLQEERITMLELRHNPRCEGLDCVDSLEEPLEEDLEGDLDLGVPPWREQPHRMTPFPAACNWCCLATLALQESTVSQL